MTEKFKIQFLEEAAEFLDNLDVKARDKIIYNIRKAQVTNDKDLFKKLNTEIWEFRTLYKNFHYRLFAFWDKSGKNHSVVIATHGIIKKSEKIPPKDLDRAERLRKHYFELKTINNKQ